MKVIYNKILPFGSFKAMNLFGLFLFVKGNSLSERTLNHESIHSVQWKETYYIGFLVIYLYEFVKNLIYEIFNTRNKTFSQKWHLAYRLISFECEAYTFQSTKDYLKTRKKNAWKQWR